MKTNVAVGSRCSVTQLTPTRGSRLQRTTSLSVSWFAINSATGVE
jgi:hypothetical protein